MHARYCQSRYILTHFSLWGVTLVTFCSNIYNHTNFRRTMGLDCQLNIHLYKNKEHIIIQITQYIRERQRVLQLYALRCSMRSAVLDFLKQSAREMNRYTAIHSDTPLSSQRPHKRQFYNSRLFFFTDMSLRNIINK